MKNTKKIEFALLLCAFFSPLQCLFSQDVHITGTVTPSNCQSSGIISIALEGADVGGLTQRIYSISGNTGKINSSAPTFTNLAQGDYIISVQGVLNDTPVTFSDTVYIDSDYTTPFAAKVVGGSGVLYGTRSSFSCQNTGRVQLQIIGGKYPYHIYTYKDGALYKTETFHTRQHTGEDYFAPDHRDYYNIENLPAGDYVFSITDSCGYTLPNITEKIENEPEDFSCGSSVSISLDTLDNVSTVSFTISAFPDIKYSLYHDSAYAETPIDGAKIWWEYSYAYDGGEYTAWTDVPPFGTTIFDPLRKVTACDIFGKKYDFRVRVKGSAETACSTELTVPDFTCSVMITGGTSNEITAGFQSSSNVFPVEYSYSYEGEAFTEWRLQGKQSIVDTIEGATRYCDIWGTGYVFRMRVQGCETPVCEKTLIMGDPNAVPIIKQTPKTEVNALGCIVIVDTLLSIAYETSTPFFSRPAGFTLVNITQGDTILNKSTATKWEGKMSYKLFDNEFHLEVYDTKGCLLLDTIIIIKKQIFPPSHYAWNTAGQSVYQNCTPEGKYDYLSITYSKSIIPPNTVITLIESPNGNFYNCQAVYIKDENRWEVTRDNDALRSDTLTAIGGTIKITAPELPSGRYRWHITDDCGRDQTLTFNATYKFYTYELTEELSFSQRKKCEGITYYPKGKAIRRLNNTGTPENVALSFKIIEGSPAGFRINAGASSGITNRDSIIFTMPGTYVLQMYYNSVESYPCLTGMDTIVYDPSTLRLKDVVGYLCLGYGDNEATKKANIAIRVDSTVGMLPFRFDLYEREYAAGSLLQSNTAGLFYNVGQAGEVFSVRVTDACGANFLQNVPIVSIKYEDKLIKGRQEICANTAVPLKGIVLGQGDIAKYKWRGPKGFAAEGREIVTPDIDSVSCFYLNIEGLDCVLRDSIVLRPFTQFDVLLYDTLCFYSVYSGSA
ncbi:MAG: hypothetical protein LBN27_07140, partial [Prevotellaceae bacterium]|nr:hypothetical protein [Prevotellaceae bacterium]